jgi:hypothetical protein
MSREYTVAETQKIFIDQIKEYVEYWDKAACSQKCKLEGLAFSILTIIDGCTNLPAFILSPDPHPTDKEYSIDLGENYFSPHVDISGDLHELFYQKDN